MVDQKEVQDQEEIDVLTWTGYGVLIPEEKVLPLLHQKFGAFEYADDIDPELSPLKFEQCGGKVLIGREYVYMPKSQCMGQFENKVIEDLKVLLEGSGIDLIPKYQILFLDFTKDELLEWEKAKP
jgi:hypothetical protein